MYLRSLFLSLAFIIPCYGMKSVSVKYKSKYTVLIEHLRKNHALSPRTTAIEEQEDLQKRLLEMTRILVKGDILSKVDGKYVSAMIYGNASAKSPSVAGRDLGLYCALLCSHKERARFDYKKISFIDQGERLTKFIPRLFCLAVHRNMIPIASYLLKGVGEYICKKKYAYNILRKYFADLIPVLFSTEQREGLKSMCDMLGKNYISSAESECLLAAFDRDTEVVGKFLDSHTNLLAFVPFMEALVVGSSVRITSNALDLVTLLIEKLATYESYLSNKEYCQGLSKQSRAAGNEEIADYLQG